MHPPNGRPPLFDQEHAEIEQWAAETLTGSKLDAEMMERAKEFARLVPEVMLPALNLPVALVAFAQQEIIARAGRQGKCTCPHCACVDYCDEFHRAAAARSGSKGECQRCGYPRCTRIPCSAECPINGEAAIPEMARWLRMQDMPHIADTLENLAAALAQREFSDMAEMEAVHRQEIGQLRDTLAQREREKSVADLTESISRQAAVVGAEFVPDAEKIAAYAQRERDDAPGGKRDQETADAYGAGQDRAQRSLKRARRALEPFAKIAREHSERLENGAYRWGNGGKFYVLLSDCRKALAALSDEERQP